MNAGSDARGDDFSENFLIEARCYLAEGRIANSGIELVETGDEAPSAREIGVVLGAEVFAEEAFFGVHTGD